MIAAEVQALADMLGTDPGNVVAALIFVALAIAGAIAKR